MNCKSPKTPADDLASLFPLKYKITILLIIATTWVATVISPAVATAQTLDFGKVPQTPGDRQPGGRPPLFDLSFESSYTVAGETKFRGANIGDSDAFNISLGLSARAPLNKHWIFPLELRLQNLYLGSLAGAPLPDDIHTLQFGTGLGYRPNDRWMFMARVTPMLYKFSDVGGNDLGVSGGLMAKWNYSPSLKFTFSLMASPDSDLKVQAMAGFDWAINKEFDLRLMFPNPRLIYKPDDHWRFHVGADLYKVTFRTSDSLGTSLGLLQYNDALGTYRDIRVGTGVGYKFKKTFSMEADAGYSVDRQIDYTRIDERVEFDPAPYVSINLLWRF